MSLSLPLWRLFAEHVEQVSRTPAILGNMPRYYFIVSGAFDAAFEQAEFELRAQAVRHQARRAEEEERRAADADRFALEVVDRRRE